MPKLTSNTSGNFRTYGIKTAEAERRYTGLYRVIVVLLILLVQIFQSIGTKLSVVSDKRLMKK